MSTHAHTGHQNAHGSQEGHDHADLPDAVRARLPASGDPTETVTLRRRWTRAFNRRWRAVRGDIRSTIGRQNALALGETSTVGHRVSPIQQYRPARLPAGDDAERQASVADWLEYVLAGRVATTPSRAAARAAQTWYSQFLRQAYARGLGLAVADAKAAGLIDSDTERFDPTQAISRDRHQSVLAQQLLATFQDIQHATEATHTDVTRTAAGLIGTGVTSRALADDLVSRVAAVGQTRTAITAETRVVDTVNKAIIEHADSMGASRIGAVPEAGQRRPREMTDDPREATWATAGDRRVCALCASLAGQTTTVEAIKKGDVFDEPPVHPRCRCRWVVLG